MDLSMYRRAFVTAAEDLNQIRSEYDRLAPIYDQRWRRYLSATTDNAVAPLDLEGDERVLDVPVGTGELAVKLLERWPRLRISGVDLSLQMLRQAAMKEVLSGIDLYEACATALPFPDDAFDLVFCLNSFHYFTQPLVVLREFRRVLRKGGHLILVDWCDDFLVCKLCSIWLGILDSAFHRIYTRTECDAMLRNCGFHIVGTSRFRIGWAWGLMRLDSM